MKFIIEVHESRTASGEPYWTAVITDESGKEWGWGSGHHGPLDAASNAAIIASNKEYHNKPIKGVVNG